jgi:hypothetical protein
MSKTIASLLALLACLWLGTPIAAAQAGAVTMAASVNGQDVGAATPSEPLRLDPGHAVDVAVVITNHGAEAVTVRQLEFAGHVLGLTFFNYSTSVDFSVAPGTTDTFHYRLELTGLKGQATGLIASAFTARDEAGSELGTISTVTDVRGSLMSVYGLFGVALLVLTAMSLLDAAVAIGRHRLSTNRWQRGLRMLTPGIGIGLVLAFSASVVRLWVPSTGLWFLVAGSTAGAFFTLGYFAPTPDEDDRDDDEIDDDALADVDEIDDGAQEPTSEFAK